MLPGVSATVYLPGLFGPEGGRLRNGKQDDFSRTPALPKRPCVSMPHAEQGVIFLDGRQKTFHLI